MIKTLIKLPLKLALFPLKVVLKATGIIKPNTPPNPAHPPRPAAPRGEPQPGPDVPADIEVQATEVLVAVNDGKAPVFVDVREARELSAGGKIEGALHIPLQDMPRRFEELGKDDDIVLYCAAGMRSYNAAMFLRDKGYDGARSLVGGLPGWTSSGGALIDG